MATKQQDYTPGLSYRYQSVQFDVRRVYQNGLSVFFAYNYHNEQTQYFYDNLASTAELDFGGRPRIHATAFRKRPLGTCPSAKGRQYLSGIPRGLDLLVGGWSVGTVLTCTRVTSSPSGGCCK